MPLQEILIITALLTASRVGCTVHNLQVIIQNVIPVDVYFGSHLGVDI